MGAKFDFFKFQRRVVRTTLATRNLRVRRCEPEISTQRQMQGLQTEEKDFPDLDGLAAAPVPSKKNIVPEASASSRPGKTLWNLEPYCSEKVSARNKNLHLQAPRVAIDRATARAHNCVYVVIVLRICRSNSENGGASTRAHLRGKNSPKRQWWLLGLHGWRQNIYLLPAVLFPL
jgi:hypothetical protein